MTISSKHFLISTLLIITMPAYAGLDGITDFGASASTQPFNIVQDVSVEAMQARLQTNQHQIQLELRDLTTQLKAVNQFIDTQKSLGLQWTNAVSGQSSPMALNVPISSGNSVALCHARFMNGTHPGILSKAGCLITYGGQSLIRPDYEVLQGTAKTTWVTVGSLNVYQNFMPTNSSYWQSASIPLQGGFEKGQPLYFCLASYNNQDYVGKTVNDNCDFAVNGREIFLKQFKVLFGTK